MRKLIFCISLSLIYLSSYGQFKVNAASQNLILENLHEGNLKYLAYTERKNGDVVYMSIWNYEIEATEDEITIKTNLKNQDKEKSQKKISINDKNSFLPKFHKTISGKGIIEAYDFNQFYVRGSDTVTNNNKEQFELKFNDVGVPFNWEQDLIFLQLLPYELNRDFLINFYHPRGSQDPKEYLYKVIGEESLYTNYGLIDTWVLKINYRDDYAATFWINKKNNIVTKMEESFGEIRHYKKLLN